MYLGDSAKQGINIRKICNVIIWELIKRDEESVVPTLSKTGFQIDKNILLRLKDDTIDVYIKNYLKKNFTTVRDLIEFLKLECEPNVFVTKLIDMDDKKFLIEFTKDENEFYRYYISMLRIIKKYDSSEPHYIEEVPTHKLTSFFENYYSFTVNKDIKFIIGYQVGYDKEERLDHLRSYGCKNLYLISRCYWSPEIYYKNVNQGSYFEGTASIIEAMEKLKYMARDPNPNRFLIATWEYDVW